MGFLEKMGWRTNNDTGNQENGLLKRVASAEPESGSDDKVDKILNAVQQELINAQREKN